MDAVLFMEGERREAFRLVRGLKNRYGATDEARSACLLPGARFAESEVLHLLDRADGTCSAHKENAAALAMSSCSSALPIWSLGSGAASV